MVRRKIPFPEEIIYLKQIKTKLDQALQEYNTAVSRHDRDYRESKRYLAEYRHEIDPTEIFQNELLIKDIEHYGRHAVAGRDKLDKMQDSPYFARIDFQADDDELEVCYIGRFHFLHQGRLLIYDWRAPISSMFYDYELGRAGFDAPSGRIEGEITRRRQFKIAGGQMEYALESSVYIQDNVLQQELSNTSDEKMKTIVTTLQKEQSLIIRNENAQKLIIQGVAGSGKTSVALHRIAYLLYRHKNTIAAKNIVIISPNRVFSDYISNVLPELGEEPVYEMSFTDIAAIQLDGVIKYDSARDPLETDDVNWAERAKLKSSLAFVKRIDCYLEQAINDIFHADDYVFDCFTIKREWIQKRYQAYQKYPVQKRLQEVADDMYGRLESENYMGVELPGKRTILKALKAMLRIRDTIALYRSFYQQEGIISQLVMPGNDRLEWEDVYPFLYFYAYFEGLKENRLIKHLVIDEMQDYTPIQYAVLNRMFQCKMTILGDFGQSLTPYTNYGLADLEQLYPGAEVQRLNKSYRSSYEIITFAGKIQPEAALEPIERHGEAPGVVECKNEEQELVRIKERLEQFMNSRHKTLAIIMKNNQRAEALYKRISKAYPVHLLTPQSREFREGITITSVQMSKGLEFDEVVIPSANSNTYCNNYDRSLLYIACTRAMHCLTLFYCGQLSVYIVPPV